MVRTVSDASRLVTHSLETCLCCIYLGGMLTKPALRWTSVRQRYGFCCREVFGVQKDPRKRLNCVCCRVRTSPRAQSACGSVGRCQRRNAAPVLTPFSSGGRDRPSLGCPVNSQSISNNTAHQVQRRRPSNSQVPICARKTQKSPLQHAGNHRRQVRALHSIHPQPN